ncbi:T-box transcription factor TBX5-A-like [Haliotis rubra]|uniref:T-box transcription factor TBX5-A-like n=1 Tax=Haliotis rubra TaxID=36100 RepID=UPI001EE61455|nr:T-box transcription factor TBX5-A-like [Haliotis rubra]
MELPLDLSVRKTTIDDVTPGDDTGISTSGDPPPPYIDGTGFIAHDVSIPSVTRHDGEVSMSLLDAHIWEAFSHNGTEMIINKTGSLPSYLHLDSPNTGAFWIQKKISFARLKLTNNRDSAVGNVMLQSMHKYKVQILIRETGKDINVIPPKTFTFPETTFMAVTAYQNSLITKLKIHNNPFAKAFRDKHIRKNYQKQSCVSTRSFPAGNQDSSHNNRKRKREPSEEDAAIKDRAGHTGGMNAVGQAMSRTKMDLATDYGWDMMPQRFSSRTPAATHYPTQSTRVIRKGTLRQIIIKTCHRMEGIETVDDDEISVNKC